MRLMMVGLALLLAGPVTAQEGAVVVGEGGSELRTQVAVETVIVPAMEQFAAAAAAMPDAVASLCAAPSDGALGTAHEAFAALVGAHAAVEWIRIGPLAEENRSERLLFWPDRKGIALKQVQAVLAEADETATDPALLAGKSVALQGLTALEFVLYGTGSETLATADGAFRCRFAAAISQAIATTAAAVAEGWDDPDGIAQRLVAPAAGNADYRTQLEAVEELVGLVSQGIEGVKDQRLGPFIASDDAAAKPKQALFWRSGLTLPALRANLEGLQALLDALQIDALPYPGPTGVANAADFEFGQAYRAFGLIKDAPEAAVADPKQAQALKYLALVLDSLQAQIGEQLPAQLGLSVGFSALDGD